MAFFARAINELPLTGGFWGTCHR